VIAVTCRNGEHFSIDPDAIERVETVNDTVLHMVDGSKYVIDQPLDDLIRSVRDHRAAALVARIHLVDGYAATPVATRNARRTRPDMPIVVLPGRDADLDHHLEPDTDEA
jgi:flagellar protein FlbD